MKKIEMDDDEDEKGLTIERKREMVIWLGGGCCAFACLMFGNTFYVTFYKKKYTYVISHYLHLSYFLFITINITTKTATLKPSPTCLSEGETETVVLQLDARR